VGYQVDPETGRQKRVQKWCTVKGTKRDAEKKLTALLHDMHNSEYVEPSKLTLGAWLTEWLETAIKPPNKRLRTHETYKSVIGRQLIPALGHLRLQQVKPTNFKRYYNASALSPTTLEHIIPCCTVHSKQLSCRALCSGMWPHWSSASHTDLKDMKMCCIIAGKPGRQDDLSAQPSS
jgi:hypothetical protein